MGLPLETCYAPMEAETDDELPVGPDWQYEPKWDGFRCLAFRYCTALELRSKSGQGLGRYFPDLEAALRNLAAERFVLDGEIVIPVGDALSFEQLQLRLHPAESRVRVLAAAYPARYMVFDLLVDAAGNDLTGWPLSQRREALEAQGPMLSSPAIAVSSATRDVAVARSWLDARGTDCDGVIAKRLSMPYRSGLRDGMVKIKRSRTADCVVGGFRYRKNSDEVGSLLLGLYDAEGRLDHVGFTATISQAERPELTRRLEALVQEPGFTGRAPGGPSRWSGGKSSEWCPVRPELVVEVEYDHVTGGRFRHGTRLVRFRPDKRPDQCRLEQIIPRAPG